MCRSWTTCTRGVTSQSFEPAGHIDGKKLRKLTESENIQRVVQQLLVANRLRELALVVKAMSRLLRLRTQQLVSRAFLMQKSCSSPPTKTSGSKLNEKERATSKR